MLWSAAPFNAPAGLVCLQLLSWRLSQVTYVGPYNAGNFLLFITFLIFVVEVLEYYIFLMVYYTFVNYTNVHVLHIVITYVLE